MSENKIELTEDQLQALTELHHDMGERTAIVSMMREISRRLWYKHSEAEAHIIEREEALIALRQKCQDAGKPTNWPDNLHLADIIQKYL